MHTHTSLSSSKLIISCAKLAVGRVRTTTRTLLLDDILFEISAVPVAGYWLVVHGVQYSSAVPVPVATGLYTAVVIKLLW